MIDSVDNFIKICKDKNINCYLLPAIAGVESCFGVHIYQGSYNPFGWGGGYIIFSSWDEAIDTVGSSLKKKYIDKGLNTVEKIGLVYAESPTWSSKVNYFLKMFNDEEKKVFNVF